MKIGFFIKWPVEIFRQAGQIIGEAFYARAMCKELAKIPEVTSAGQYDPMTLPDTSVDVMIYMNDMLPVEGLAKKHVLYLQNGYEEGMDNVLARLRSAGYDGYAFISSNLLTLHQSQGYSGIYLPFGVDVDQFYPRVKTGIYDYDVAYAGNDIKGLERTVKYIYPAVYYNKFGLFGRWADGPSIYQQTLAQKCQGMIAREELPYLYSAAKINLNFTAQDQVNWGAMTDRPFQVMACKGFVITDYIPDSEKQLAQCLVVTEGGIDLINKIDYYLTKPREREEIAACGYQYVLNYATMQARVQTLYRYLREIC